MGHLREDPGEAGGWGGGSHMKPEAEMGVKANECIGCQQSLETERHMEPILPQSFQREPTLSTTRFQGSGLQNYGRKKMLLFKALKFVVICFSRPRK